jgi:hypothetical protein
VPPPHSNAFEETALFSYIVKPLIVTPNEDETMIPVPPVKTDCVPELTEPDVSELEGARSQL